MQSEFNYWFQLLKLNNLPQSQNYQIPMLACIDCFREVIHCVEAVIQQSIHYPVLVHRLVHWWGADKGSNQFPSRSAYLWDWAVEEGVLATLWILLTPFMWLAVTGKQGSNLQCWMPAHCKIRCFATWPQVLLNEELCSWKHEVKHNVFLMINCILSGA